MRRVLLTIDNHRVSDINYLSDETYVPKDNEVIVSQNQIRKMLSCSIYMDKIAPSDFRIGELKKILEVVFGLEYSIDSRERTVKYCIARYTGMEILYRKEYGTLSEIGAIFKRGHCMVIHALKIIEDIRAIKDKTWLNKIEIANELYEKRELP